MYYVYLLLLKNNTIYKGSTSNLKNRYKDHNSGKVESTKNFLPVKLICYEAYILKKDAQTREKYLKTGDGRKDIQRRLKNYFENLKK